MASKKNNLSIFIGALILILLLLFFSLGKIIWQKKQKEENTFAEKQENIEKEKIPEEIFPTISPEELEKKIGQEDFLLIDLRPDYAFADSHIESSINILPDDLENLSEKYKNKKIIIIDDPIDNSNTEKITALKNRGFEILYLAGGFRKYQLLELPTISFGYTDSLFDVAKTKPIDSETLKNRVESGERFKFLDVRPKEDFVNSHISGSVNIPLEELEARKKEIPFGRIVVVDNNPLRSFRAAVKLFDMHFIDILYLSEDLEKLKD